MAEGSEKAENKGFSKEAPPPSWDGGSPHQEFERFERDVKLWEFETEVELKKRGARLLRVCQVQHGQSPMRWNSTRLHVKKGWTTS